MVLKTIFLSVSPSFSPGFLTMSSSAPTGVGRVNNSYQEPMLEDNGCPFLEDYFRNEEEQCDSEVESQDDGWPGTENPLVSSVGFIVSLPHWSTRDLWKNWTWQVYQLLVSLQDLSPLWSERTRKSILVGRMVLCATISNATKSEQE